MTLDQARKICQEIREKYDLQSESDYHEGRKAEDERRKFNETIRARILDQILEKISDLDLEDERFIIAHRFDALWDEYRHRIFKRHGWERQKGQHGGREYRIEKILAPMKNKDLNRLSLEMELITFIRLNEYQPQSASSPLFEMAKRHGIDVKVIENQVKTETKAKKEKKSPVQTSAKSKKKAMKVRIDRLDLLILGLIAIVLDLVIDSNYWSLYGGV